MFYHARPLKFVTYGKVGPPPIESLGGTVWDGTYRWLGEHCGYCPQVWLSRSRSLITGYRRLADRPDPLDLILFGFESIQGFRVDYSLWESLLNVLFNTKGGFAEQNQAIARHWDSQLSLWGDDLPTYLAAWDKTRDLDHVLHKYLFVENDQVVVPSLNLKSAKEIICRNESEKKQLRQLGFIENRIQIRNTRPRR